MNKRIILSLLSILPLLASAQNNNAPSSYEPHEVKITGYLQTQFQKSQGSGISSFSGGDFEDNSDNRFMIRRGRLKVDRVDSYSSMVIQIDATQNGVQLMDAFIQLNLPDKPAYRLTGGVFNRPFGYAIAYSSGYREFPERPRMYQTIMPRERDIGGMFSYNPANLKFFKADVAVVNGAGLFAKDFDSKKDFVGNVHFEFDSLANKNLQIGFGASVYKGTVRNNTDTYFNPGDQGFIANQAESNEGANLKREYFGANLQLEYKHSLGTTGLKAEYVYGTQPGVAASSDVRGPDASVSFKEQPMTDLYLRNFSGYYIWFTQQILKSKFTAIASYDVYDPNTDIDDDQIGTAANTTAGDIRFNTLGYGFTYQYNSRVKLTAYNEHVRNGSTALENYQKDIRDNVFTLRLQYRW